MVILVYFVSFKFSKLKCFHVRIDEIIIIEHLIYLAPDPAATRQILPLPRVL